MNEKLEVIIKEMRHHCLDDSFFVDVDTDDEKLNIWTAKSNNNIAVASADTYILYDDKNNIYFSSLNVLSEYRKRGIATQIIKFHLELAKALDRISYITVKEGSWMQEWYERLGYKEVSDVEYMAEDGFIWMSNSN